MRLVEDGSLPDNVEIAIVNGFFQNHPFKSTSGQLVDFILVFEDIRALPQEGYTICLDAVKQLVEKNNGCAGCYSKGLIYLKLLAKGLNDEISKDAAAEYNRIFRNSRTGKYGYQHKYRDYEMDVVQKMLGFGVARKLLLEWYKDYYGYQYRKKCKQKLRKKEIH